MTKDGQCKDILSNCLYFTSNKLNRIMNRMADEEFSRIGLSTSYAMALMTIDLEPGLSQNELSKLLNIKPSTTSRFIDKLESKELAKRKVKGKVSYIYPTEKGLELQEEMAKCWENLHRRYSNILGEKEGDELTSIIYNAANELENKFQD
ncbi:MAG: MarR family transcriptional regulator [Methanobacterium sp.]|uniref:MarR family winged helix-turn-helix transcriptional regulator n=1 Tax=Methanobacterium sp. TaxID=2164 RepID=UPI003D65983E|nr:MarR family transcriptional regulator [Methanobacterium sp.]